MKYSIGTSPRDAETARRDVRHQGDQDGAKNFPPVDPSGEKSTDYLSGGLVAEAITTSTLANAGHLAAQRTNDDTTLGKARPQTARHTARTCDDRQRHQDALAEERSYKQGLPLSAKFGFWDRRVVWGLLVALAAASGAAVTAALLSVTTDQEHLTYVIGLGVAIAAVVGGAALGSLLRRRDLDAIQEGKYASTSTYSTVVIVLGIIGLIGIAVGVAGLRDAATEADAARRAEQTQIEVFVPGQEQTEIDAESEAPGWRGVGWPIWFAFELGLAAAALSIEFQRADVRSEHGERLARAAKQTHKQWLGAHEHLATAVGEHEVALAVRADHDGAVILTGDAQKSFAVRLQNDYRHSNLSQRGQAGDPFDALSDADVIELERTFDNRPGVDVVALTPAAAAEPDVEVPFLATQRDGELLTAAYEELRQAPHRMSRADTETWVPGDDLALDASAQALHKALSERAEKTEAVPDAPAEEQNEIVIPGELVSPSADNGSPR